MKGGDAHPTRSARRARWLSIEPRSVGLAVQAPDFYVWDPVHESALAWAADLHAAAPNRRVTAPKTGRRGDES